VKYHPLIDVRKLILCHFEEDKMNVIEYCTEEVQRQTHDTKTLDGIERVGWMLNGWSLALEWSKERLPNKVDIYRIGAAVERKKNANGPRVCDVWVGDKKCPPPNQIDELMNAFLDELKITPHRIKPLDFYRQFLEIHPFVDGNGRTGKVILNWINGTLLSPIFTPNDFWGRVIRNP
jgi:hypothetical protein